MSGSEKSSHGHVRFRDGDDLVEFDDGPKSAAKPDTSSAKRKGIKDGDKATVSPAQPDTPSTSSKAPKSKNSKENTSASAKSIVIDLQPDGAVDVPSPAGAAQQEEKKEVDELKLKYFSAFQTINRVHGGAIMKIKVGVAGTTPAKDSFPMFSSTKRWVCLHWDADSVPSQWCVAYYADPPAWFDRALHSMSTGSGSASSKYSAVSASSTGSEKSSPTNGSNSELGDAFTSGSGAASSGPGLIESSLYSLPELSTALKTIRMHEISDLYLEVAPAVAFRLYCGKEVIHFTPVNAYNVLSKRSSCWADSIYSALALLQEPDMELVQLYKQEFVSLLQQHADDQQQQSATSAGGGAGPATTGSAVEGNSDTPAAPRRPGLMRRRSTLSNFLGISASKPLDESAFEDSNINGVPQSDGQQSEGENDTSESPELRKKISFFSAVSRVRSAIKQTLLSSQSSDKEENSTNRNSFKRSWLLDRKVSVIKHKRPSYYQQVNSAQANSGETEDGREQGEGEEGAESQEERASGDHSSGSVGGSAKHSPVPVEKSPTPHAPPPGSANFLSQSLLSMRSGLSLSNNSNPRSVSPGGVSASTGSTAAASDLQAQIEELREQNRLLQHQLYSGSTGSVHSTAENPSSTMTCAGNNQPFQQRSSSPPSGAQSPTQSDVPLPAMEYTTKELTTLRAFTARTNFHHNQNASKNATRAFGGDTKVSDLNKYRRPSPTTKTKADFVQPVLGTASVLDRLVSQQSTATTSAQTGAEDQFTYQGDDYYNDTIELDPLSIVQLLELHKLQQLEQRREAGNNEEGRTSDVEGDGGSGVEDGGVPSPQSRRRRESAAARRTSFQSASPSPSLAVELHSTTHLSGALPMEAPAASAVASRPLPPVSADSPASAQSQPTTVKKTSLGSGIQSHPSAALTAAASAGPTTGPSVLHKQPSLTSALLHPGPTSSGSKPKKSVSIVEQQLQATTQRELRLLNLLSGAEPPLLPTLTETAPVKPRSYSVESEHKSDGERRGRSDSSSKAPTGGTSASDKSDHRSSSKSSDDHNKSRSDSLQSDSRTGRPHPSPASPAKSTAKTAEITTHGDSPDRTRKAVQRRQLNSSSAKLASKGGLGSGLLAAAMPRLSIGTVDSDRQSDRHSDSQHSSSARAVRGSAEFERTVDKGPATASSGKIVRTPQLGDKVRAPLTSPKSESTKIPNVAQTMAPDVPSGAAKAVFSARDGVQNMRPYSYDSGPEGGTESSATVTDIESLKAPKWSNNYFYANSNPRREVKRVRKGRVSADIGDQGTSAPRTTSITAEDKISVSWSVFLAGLPSAHTVHALCAAGAVECLLLSQRELMTALRVCKMRLFCADSAAGMQEFSAHDAHTFQEHYVVLVHADAGELVFVPLSDMVGAELDTNNTGLFKLTMHLRRTTSSAVSTHRTDSADSCNSLVRNLTAHMVSAEDTDGTLRSELRGADQVVRPVSLVLKAIQTLQLVEWLTALMDLRA